MTTTETSSSSRTLSLAEMQAIFSENVAPTYGRFPLALVRGKGSEAWDAEGRRYIDFAAGIAVNSLGHCHPAIVKALTQQAKTLIHTSNLYYTEPQGRLAQRLVALYGPGKVFFCNSGAEANETMYKLARKFGHDTGRYEIITTAGSFHGRTLAGISATGQEKVKKGFEPMVDGFKHVPYNDLNAVEAAITPKTAAVLIEGIQGESGIVPASPEYLIGLRELTRKHNILLLMDGVQCGYFRTGKFQSYKRILDGDARGAEFTPDAMSSAKSIAGGFPMGATWIAKPYADVLSPGTHASTFGGTPLACAVALAVLDTIEKENLADNAWKQGDYIVKKLKSMIRKYPSVLKEVRGMGLMIGLQLQDDVTALKVEGKTPAQFLVTRLHENGVLTVPAGTHVIRFLPALNIKRKIINEGLDILEKVIAGL